MKAVAYYRTDTADNFDAQKQLVEFASGRQGYELVGEFHDLQTSGLTELDQRNGFQTLVNLVHTEGITRLIVSDLSRISRDFYTFMSFSRWARDNDIELYIVSIQDREEMNMIS